MPRAKKAAGKKSKAPGGVVKSSAAFLVTLEGSFYKQTERGKLVTKYKNLEAEIPVGVKPQDIMWYLKNKWFPANIETLHPEASSVREIKIVEKRPLEGARNALKSDLPDGPDFSRMNLKQLDEFVMAEALPLNVSDFSSIDQARQKVADLFEDKKLLDKNKGKAKDTVEKEFEDDPVIEALPEEDEDGDNDVID